MSELYQSLSHSKWDCKYHVVFVLYSCPNDDARPSLAKRVFNWGQFSTPWPNKKSAKSSKDT